LAYDYYAAFSHSFARRALEKLKLAPDQFVLDPWNGRGTTTAIAAELGIAAKGFDLNPAMVTIAKARLAPCRAVERALELILEIASGETAAELDDDGLSTWLRRPAVIEFRSLQRAIQSAVKSDCLDLSNTAQDAVASFLQVVLCRALRRILRPFETSNPSWIRQRVPVSHRLNPSKATIWSLFNELATTGVLALEGRPPLDSAKIEINTADSRSLPLRDAICRAVVSSPPYCTRIDYAIATSPELFLLEQLSREQFNVLRGRMIGTTAIANSSLQSIPFEWGNAAASLLNAIYNHPAKASSTYYFSTYVQYLSGLSESLSEISRVATCDADITLVVQDSYYKDVHVDLQQIVIDMADAHGWRLDNRVDHALPHTLAGTNPNTRTYRSDFAALETVLSFKKQ
jgi:SAM-dependent methyltransferase